MQRILKPKWFTIPPNPPDEPPKMCVPDFIPEGEYILEVEHIEEKRSQWSNEYYSLRCKVLNSAVHEDFRVYLVLSTVPRALWRFGEFIEATTGAMPRGQFLFSPLDYVGARFYAELKHQRWNNKTVMQVGRLNWYGIR